jgi:hypothetical protein
MEQSDVGATIPDKEKKFILSFLVELSYHNFLPILQIRSLRNSIEHIRQADAPL